MPDGKEVKPPTNMEWLNKSQIQVITRISARVIKRVMEEQAIPSRQANAKTIEYKSELALKALFADQFGIGGSGDSKMELKTAETNLKIEQSKNYRLKNEVLEGKLIEVDALEVHWVNMTTQMKSRIRSLPVRVAQSCAGMDDMKQIEIIAQEIVDEALQELAGDLLPSVSFDGEEDEYDDDEATATEDTERSSGSGQATTEADG